MDEQSTPEVEGHTLKAHKPAEAAEVEAQMFKAGESPAGHEREQARDEPGPPPRETERDERGPEVQGHSMKAHGPA